MTRADRAGTACNMALMCIGAPPLLDGMRRMVAAYDCGARPDMHGIDPGVILDEAVLAARMAIAIYEAIEAIEQPLRGTLQ